jgi:nicotinamide-nucleotide amidase
VTPEEEIGRFMRERGWSLALAESCTGGLIAARITDVPGSSAYFIMGFVTYDNGAKERFLSVPREAMVEKGAVSPEVARSMAEGARSAAGVDVALSVTGIAGPEGGSREKPVGTVYMGLSCTQRTFVRRFLFRGDRAEIRRSASEEGLKMILDYCEGRLS